MADVNLLEEFTKQIAIFETVSKYTIEYGIMPEDGSKMLSVSVLNTDDTLTTTKLSVEDVMYLTEYGTMTIPARFILKKAYQMIDFNLDVFLERVLSGVFQYNWSASMVEIEFNNLAQVLENSLRSSLDIIVGSNATLSKLLKIEDENKYLYDLKQLKQYIKVKVNRY